MIEIGRLCIKTAGRDSNCKCVIIDIIDSKMVLVDGETRRKKVNVLHLEPTTKKIDIKKGASRADIVKEFKKLGIELKEKKSKKKQEKPKKVRMSTAKKEVKAPVKKK
jgi:large subunit ribosomal protein L14e